MSDADEMPTEPAALRWGLDDVEYGDDGDTVVLLSDTDGRPYTLTLGTDRAAALRETLAGPAAPEQAAPSPLRDRIAAALIRWTYRGEEPDPETGILETVRANAYSRADAVLAVLPAPADRAGILRDFLWRLEQACGDVAAEQPAPCGRGDIPTPCSAGDWCCTGPDDDEEQAPEADVTTRQCGHDDYHDGHPWHEQPHTWCPGHRQ